MNRFVSICLVLCLAASASSAETFRPKAEMDALDQPEGQRTVIHLQPTRDYQLEKRGGPGGRWCKLRAGNVTAWVECADGKVGAPAVTRGDVAAPSPAACASKCDQKPLLSEPLSLSKVDREVLALCPSRPDRAVTGEEVSKFIAAHYDDPRIQRALSAAGRPGSGLDVRTRNIEWLTSLWVSSGPRNAFTHVFCGDEWEDRHLGGLHYLPRYAQLESEGKVCYKGPVKGRLAKQGERYLIRYSGLSPWSCGNKPVGGFATRHDPIELIAAATRAFVRCCDRDGRKEGGVYRAPDLGKSSWRIWCGTRNGTYGIATFYPVGDKPTCGD